MIVIWTPNPLKSVVTLNDDEKKLLWHRVKVEELEERIVSADGYLDPKRREWSNKHIKELTLEKGVEIAHDYLDASYILNDEERNGKKFDATIDDKVKDVLGYLTEPHEGDCTCFPCSCSKCYAEHLIEFDTTPGLGKHPGHYIWSAFHPRTKDGPEPTIQEALEYLRDYKPKKTDVWKDYTDEQWQKLVEGWTADAKRAHDWLLKYQQLHFPSE